MMYRSSLRRRKRGSDLKRASFHQEDREHQGQERDKNKDDTSGSEGELLLKMTSMSVGPYHSPYG